MTEDELARLADDLENREGRLPPRPTQYRRGWAAASKAAAMRLRAATPVADTAGIDAARLLSEAVERGWVNPGTRTNQPDDPWLVWQTRYFALAPRTPKPEGEPE